MSFDLTMTTQTTTIWFVYMLECLNGKIYTGITTDVETRFLKHNLWIYEFQAKR
jgi:predicted GIY-YIG superfamily endonuclease